MTTLSSILDIIVGVIVPVIEKILPDEADKIRKLIADLKKESNEKRQLLLKALQDGDVDALNRILGELFGEL